MRIGGVLLAAGKSKRMGGNKLLLPWKNHTIIEEVLHQVSRSSLDSLLVVTGFEKDSIEELLARSDDKRIRSIHNEGYESGRIGSIQCAIEHLKGSVDGALFMVADKPTVHTELIERAIGTFKKEKPGILYVMTPAGRGHPIIYSSKLFEEIMLLTHDDEMEKFIEEHKNEVAELEDEAIQVNINTPEEYERVQKSL